MKAEYEELYDRVLKNPHFASVRELTAREKLDEEGFFRTFRDELTPLLQAHENDNPVLKEECFSYILPAVAMYRTMQKYCASPLELFREMWLDGAEKGARYLREKAKDDAFLASWIQNVTPKNCNAGAFMFEIDHVTESETEYHVLRCPYAELCGEYGCPEIVTVFCDSDDISFGAIHPRLIWGRTETIGRGASFCDFKYTLLLEKT